MNDEGPREAPAWAGFDWSRERYEDLVNRIIPDYRLQETLISQALREAGAVKGRGPFRILELGSGTGTLSRHLLGELPRAVLAALDVSPVMVEECAALLAPFGGRARVVEADIATADLGSGYQAVVSRLAIHHLDDEQKQDLFRRALAALLPAGVFLNCDLVAGETEAEMESMLAEWRAYMIARGDDPDEWAEWLVGDDDHPASERAQMEWLLMAGFSDVRTIWRRANFALVGGTRPEGGPGCTVRSGGRDFVS